MEKECYNCYWWKDFEDRVYACISDTYGTGRCRDSLELRKCKWVPNPNITDIEYKYTDRHFVCSCWTEDEK
jgi:hypothetical protein